MKEKMKELHLKENFDFLNNMSIKEDQDKRMKNKV